MKKLAKIQSSLICPKDQYNSFGKYQYRSCEQILEAVKPLLDGAIFTLSDEIVNVGGRIYVKATATFIDGDFSISTTAYARETEDRKGMDSSQITGSASSYARKYCLGGLFLIDDTKDADATNDHKTTTDKKQTKTPDLPFPGFKDVLGRINKLKSQIVDLDGNDSAYWEALKLYGVENATEFKTRDAMIDFGKDLKAYIDKKGVPND